MENGLPEVAWKYEIPLTKFGKVDRRFKIGRALAPRLEELDTKRTEETKVAVKAGEAAVKKEQSEDENDFKS